MLKGRLPAIGGALFLKALDAALAQVPEREVCAESEEAFPLHHAARRADALVRMAESALQDGRAMLGPPNTTRW